MCVCAFRVHLAWKHRKENVTFPFKLVRLDCEHDEHWKQDLQQVVQGWTFFSSCSAALSFSWERRNSSCRGRILVELHGWHFFSFKHCYFCEFKLLCTVNWICFETQRLDFVWISVMEPETLNLISKTQIPLVLHCAENIQMNYIYFQGKEGVY